MSRDDVNDLILGAVVVVLGYALYKHFKVAAPASVTASQPSPMGIAVGEVTGNATTSGPTSPYTSLKDLLTGTVHDIGGFDGKNYLAMIEGNYW